MHEKKQLFFSHTWRPDNLGRNTHERVYELVKSIRNYGWTTWFDEENMYGNIDAAMTEGIDNAEVVIICLTETYIKKINESAKDPRRRDNCLKEWTYTNSRNKLMIPLIMEPCLLNISDWPASIVTLYLGSTLYIDASKDNFCDVIENLNKTLYYNNIYPYNKSLEILSHINNNNDNISQEEIIINIEENQKESITKKSKNIFFPKKPKHIKPVKLSPKINNINFYKI